MTQGRRMFSSREITLMVMAAVFAGMVAIAIGLPIAAITAAAAITGHVLTKPLPEGVLTFYGSGDPESAFDTQTPAALFWTLLVIVVLLVIAAFTTTIILARRYVRVRKTDLRYRKGLGDPRVTKQAMSAKALRQRGPMLRPDLYPSTGRSALGWKRRGQR